MVKLYDMEIIEVNGDLLDSPCVVLAHQVNCMGVMGSGVARAIKEKWIDVFLEYLKGIQSLDHNCLGGCLVVQAEEGKYVANLFGQYYYNGYFKDPGDYLKQEFWKQPELGDSIRFTNYEALYKSLKKLKVDMVAYNIPSVAFPYKMGADRGGGSWEIIRKMIEEIFKDTNIKIEIRRLG